MVNLSSLLNGCKKDLMNTAQYCRNNLLVIPQALDALNDLTLVAKFDGSSIYYKSLEQNLIDIEFYTNQPCLLYIEEGEEELTTWENSHLTIKEGQFIFLHQGQNLHSDFVKTTKSLKAWMVFFDRAFIQDFLVSKTVSGVDVTAKFGPLRTNHSELVTLFFKQLSLYRGSQLLIKEMLTSKLNELFCLLEHELKQEFFSLLTKSEDTLPARRNLKRLLNNDEVLSLSVADLAKISGRSQSSFHRDFKQSFGLSPKQWLFNRRMEIAKSLVDKKELSVTEIALSVGYGNVSHFIQSYKNKFGLTPKQDGLLT